MVQQVRLAWYERQIRQLFQCVLRQLIQLIPALLALVVPVELAGFPWLGRQWESFVWALPAAAVDPARWYWGTMSCALPRDWHSLL